MAGNSRNSRYYVQSEHKASGYIEEDSQLRAMGVYYDGMGLSPCEADHYEQDQEEERLNIF